MARDLENIARNLVQEIVQHEEHGLDLGAIREAINDRAHEAADSACIYYHHCEEIIRDYETDPRADTETADEMGQTFKPSEYQNAMQAYAFWIARSIIEAEAGGVIDEIEEAIDHLEACDKLPPDVDRDSFVLTADCPHGWAAHDYEDDIGTCFWMSRQVDGCNAIAVPAGPVWVSYTWEPKP
jgi:hypothetical protein